jgi:RecA-family ATPase
MSDAVVSMETIKAKLAAAKAEPVPLRLVDPTTLEGLAVPERQWVVPDWIPFGVVTALYGPGGTGKSLLVQQLITTAAIGGRWLGMPVTPVRSLAVFCEDDDDELHRRQAAINRLYGCGFADLGAVKWLPRLGEANTFMTFDKGVGEVTEFAKQIKQAALDHGAQLVIFDTLADGFAGNQNDAGQARQFVQGGFARLARAINGAVVVCAHPSLAGINTGEGSSGSVQWEAAVRSRMYLSAPKKENDEELVDPDARVLTRKKANYAARGETVEIRWSDGVFVTDADTCEDRPRPDAETVFLAILDKTTSEGQVLSHSSRAGNYAPKVFITRPERQGYRQPDFLKAMQSLLSKGDIRIEDYGRSGDRRKRLARGGPTLPF